MQLRTVVKIMRTNLTKEEKKTYHKTYYIAHKEELQARNRAYHHANKDRLNALHREWYIKNQQGTDELREYKRQWYIEHYNPEEANRKSKIYRQSEEGKMKRRLAKHQRRTIEKEGNITIAEINNLLSNANNICAYCRKNIPEGKLQFDHIIPLIKGGKHHIDNLAISCEPCNKSKSSRDLDVFLKVINA